MIENQFKLATIKEIPPFKSEDLIIFHLKKRNKNEYVILKAENFEEDEEYCRIKMISHLEIRDIHESERNKLYAYLLESQKNIDNEIIPFINQVNLLSMSINLLT